MRRYETIIIIDPDLSDEDRIPIFERLKDLIPKHEGFLILLDEWGIKKLAYEIMKKLRGYYLRIEYCGTSTLVNEMERFFRIDDRVLKYMTVLLEKDVDVEAIKEEIAKKEIKENLPDQQPDQQSDQQSDQQNDKSDSGQNLSDAPEQKAAENEEIENKSNDEES